MSEFDSSSLLGLSFEGYTIRDLIDGGGAGSVWRAEDSHGTPWAVKVFRLKGDGSPKGEPSLGAETSSEADVSAARVESMPNEISAESGASAGTEAEAGGDASPREEVFPEGQRSPWDSFFSGSRKSTEQDASAAGDGESSQASDLPDDFDLPWREVSQDEGLQSVAPGEDDLLSEDRAWGKDDSAANDKSVEVDDTASLDASFLNLVEQVELLRAIHHPNLLELKGVFRLDTEWAAVVMEYLYGQDLAARLAGQGRMPLAELIPVLRQALAGLERLHSGHDGQSVFLDTVSARRLVRLQNGTVKC